MQLWKNKILCDNKSDNSNYGKIRYYVSLFI